MPKGNRHMARRLTIDVESWPIAGEFRISRGAKTEAHVVVVNIEEDGLVGRGECVPYQRYRETVEYTVTLMEAARPHIESGLSIEDLPSVMKVGSTARNAVDAALWDLRAKQTGIPVWKHLGLAEPKARVTCTTISLSSPEDMAAKASAMTTSSMLKMKLGGELEDIERVRAVRAVRPDAKIFADGNEGFEPDVFLQVLPELEKYNLELLEQPLRAGSDAILETLKTPIPICADESIHTRIDLEQVTRRKYAALNIKLDKCGGLSEAVYVAREGRKRGMKIMLGCMVGTSLSIAPIFQLSSVADWLDLDGPLLLKKDREPGIRFEGCTLHPPTPDFWG